jgi:hypothetical protein
MEENGGWGRLVQDAAYDGYWFALRLQRRATMKSRLFIVAVIIGLLLLAALGAVINTGRK